MSSISIISNDLKKYTISSKSARFDNGWILESKFGTISVKFPFIKTIKLIAQKISGNGKIRIKQDENYYNVVVASKNSQTFFLPFVGEGQIDFFRTLDSIGEVNIIGFEIETEVQVEEKDSILAQNWKAVISKCGKSSLIRLVAGRLFAGDGGFIEGANIISNLETHPTNMYCKDDGKIKFLGDCEIIKIELSGSVPNIPLNTKLYIHRDEPTPVALPAAPIKQKNNWAPMIGIPASTPKYQPQPLLQNANAVLYDSLAMRGFDRAKIGNDKNIKIIPSNGKEYLLIKKGGVYAIPVSSLNPHTEYVIILHMKKLNGNGRIHLGFGLTNSNVVPTNTVPVLSDSQFIDHFITVNTSSPGDPGEIYKLFFTMKDDGNGEVLVERVRIINGINIDNVKIGLNTPYFSTLPNDRSISAISVNYSLAVDEQNNPVLSNAKRYARYVTAIKPSTVYTQLRGDIVTTTASGLNWLNKISSFFPNVQTQKAKDNITTDTALIGKIGALLPAQKIWLDVFNSDDISSNDLSILRAAKMIFSPSLPNVQYLDDKCPQSLCTLMYRPLPFTDPQFVPLLAGQEFVLAFNRDYRTTKRLIDCWTPELPKIVLVGARGNYPNFVIPVNEYFSYDKLLFAICAAKCVIDLPIHSDYISSFLHFAQAAGTPIASTNWYAMDKNYSTFLINDSMADGLKMPSTNTLHDGIVKTIKLGHGPNTLNNYNQNLFNGLSTLLNGK